MAMWQKVKRAGRTILEKQIANLWARWHTRYAERYFKVDPSSISPETYLQIAEKARVREFPEFLTEIEEQFGFLPEKDFVDELALSTQVVIKRSEILYTHGYLLYAALRSYLEDHPGIGSVTILETGTARGFSAVMMAKALDDAGRPGKIITIDPLPSEKPIYWNCIHDAEGEKTRFELLSPWRQLVDNYVIFIQGYSYIVLQQLGFSRVHFAFLDGAHRYKDLSLELDFVASHQNRGDVVICDDYTPRQFPGLVLAMDEFKERYKYNGRIFQIGDERGYGYFRK